MENERLFLGLDSSTQGLKASLMNEQFEVIREAAIRFDEDVSEFKTEGGVHHHADGVTVTSPPLMWVAALDLLLQKMCDERWPLGQVAAVSGSGQQHGSVWLRRGARATLQALDPAHAMRRQLADIFAVEASPIWMDSSTTEQCRALEAALGGAQAVAELTGSRAYERFTGNQIAKLYQTQRAGYEEAERIALVSSFMASLCLGDYAPIDTSDGSGMNVMDIHRREWAPAALAATAPGLAEKLGAPVAAHTVLGPVSPYLVARHGFNPEAVVVAFSGDNPCSLAGLRLRRPGELAVSLGTSDTLFGSSMDPRPSGEEGHVFVNPVDPEAFMVMLVHKNGSLTRERVRELAVQDGSWKTYAALMDTVPPGNGGKVGFYVYEPEITPPIMQTGIFCFDAAGQPVDDFTPAEHARAVLESQFLSLRLHAERIGLAPRQIISTGGASVDPAVIGVLCDVFGVPVRVAERADSASFGAACRALHGWRCRETGSFVPYAESMAGAPEFRLAREPVAATHQVYSKQMAAFAALEARIAAGS